MENSSFESYLRKYGWLTVIFLMILAGYTVGKDMALRDNAREDRAAQEEGQ